ncbi:MAG TPA: hypothetical protein DCS63_00985 [Elusimicrobia bacterium]|nr:hypothetical protein [Elusimicrobiota bacterium]
MSIANKYHVFRLHEFLAVIGLATAACWAVYPENRLTELVLAEKNSPVSIKYLESIVRLNPGNGAYRILLADRYLWSGRPEPAMAQLLAVRETDPVTRFSCDVRVLALYRQAPKRFGNTAENGKLTARTMALINLETSRSRLGAIYTETSAVGLWPAAFAAAEKILPFETWNTYFWLLRAAAAAEQAGNLPAASGYYIKAAACAPDTEKRRLIFRKAFTVLSAAGLHKDIRRQLSASAPAFSGDKHTAATLLSFARQTGDAYFARDIALVILRTRQ